MSWDPVIVATKNLGIIYRAAWSPCSRFIAIDGSWFMTEVQILDAVTLRRVKSLTRLPGFTRLLSFSAEGHSLIRGGGEPEDFISWDLQTGVLVSTISPEQGERECHHPSGFFRHLEKGAVSITYSGCGTMFGVLSKRHDATAIITYNLLLGRSVGSYPVKGPVADVIWTYNKSIRFATLGPGSITTWEVGFVSENPATEVEHLPTPNSFDPSEEFLFLPTLSRLSFVLEDAIFVWDAKCSKLLLSYVDIDRPREMSFSSDGRFFACATGGPEIYLWKDSPTGYTLHQKFVSATREYSSPWKPLLSPDGRSLLAFSGLTLQLWHTTDPTTSLSSVSTQAVQDARPFVLGFSPDHSLAAAARLGSDMTTVLDLRTGIPRLTIDTGMTIYGLGVAESTVVVVGDSEIVTWNLPKGDRALNATANIDDSVRIIAFDHLPSSGLLPSAAISPDFNHIAVVGVDVEGSVGLNLYDATTGNHLAGIQLVGEMPWFAPDGHKVWYRYLEGAYERTIVKDNESYSLKLEHLGPTRRQPEGCPWTPSRGYKITDDGWILSSNGRRLLWLPPHWRSTKVNRMWSGRFLAFLHHQLPEVVILELLE